jgi:hypothetical protein
MTNNNAGSTGEKRTRRRAAVFVAVLSLMAGGCVGPPSDTPAQQAPTPHLAGKVVGNIYTSPEGHFSVPFPVSPEVGGRVISDDAESVTFHDNWGSKIGFSSGVIAPGSPMMYVLHSEGPERALEDYVTHRYGDLVVPHFHPDILGGAVSLVYLRPIGPKTGVAAFIQGGRVYLVETDLLPGVQLLSKDDEEGQEEKDGWLENRAVQLLQSIAVR